MDFMKKQLFSFTPTTEDLSQDIKDQFMILD